MPDALSRDLKVPHVGLENDADIGAALEWFGRASGDPTAFRMRLRAAQRTYTALTAGPDALGQDLSLTAMGKDIVASFFAQAKSLLDDRRSFDFALASRCIPWVKQIGVNVEVLSRVPGACERARRMLENRSTEPDSGLFELAMAGNYAADGDEVVFVEEQKGMAKTPDLHLFAAGHPKPVAVEFKRLRSGRYEFDERELQRSIFQRMAKVIDRHSLSVHIDVNYTVELKDIPESYLADWLLRYLSSPLITPGRYPWHDEFGSGEIRPANVAAVLDDIADSSLYFGTKLARLLAGCPVRESGYHLVAELDPDERDPRYFEAFHFGSVITWQCTAPASIDRKARHVKAKLVEAGRQVKTQEVGVIHLAMDAEIGCESSDLRRQRNKEVIQEFHAESLVAALYVHYLVPRVSESHAWLIDETVDKFGQGEESVPKMMIFSGSTPLENGLPAWRQTLGRPPQSSLIK
ncbi:MAG: hypothetical protein KAY54_01810 [Burkholderiaceae bacterium]|nr:hypothetical protein [Burkholderiaceae bacterium]